MMMKNRTIICLVSVLITSFIVLGVTTSAKASEKLKIGAIWGLSGPGSQLRVIMRDGSVLAAEWLSKKGGSGSLGSNTTSIFLSKTTRTQ
jgi:hypothetical protein